MTSPNAYLKNAADFDGKHNFLAEELLQPMVNRVDVARVNMFTGQLSQAVVLDAPERPRVFSRFENAFGVVTTAVRRMARGGRIIGVFERNPLQRVYAYEYDDGTAGIHFAAPARHLTETYGYLLDNSPLAGAEEGNSFEAGDIVQGWPCHDAEGNFMYGANLRTVYMNLDGLTYEDGLVISESAADRLSHTSVEVVTVTLNANDLTLNLYGEGAEDYQGFPDVGQQIKGGVLLARRRINHDSILYELSTPQLGRINQEGDTIFYAEGSVMDIEVFSNLSDAELEKHVFNRQILAHHRRWREFQQWVVDVFGPYVTGENGKGYTEDVAFHYRTCLSTMADKWRFDRNEYDGVVVRFTIAKTNPVAVGSKLTNRYGGKGVVSQIRPDHLMPRTKSGKVADIVVNSLGVVNRLNPAQLFESELNFIADHVQAEIRELCSRGSAARGYARMLEFLKIVSPEQAKWMDSNLSIEEKALLAQEVASGEPIYIHQPPIFGVVSLDGLAQAYRRFGVEREEFVGIEERMVLGTNYYMKLRHEPSGKHSARSAKHLSVNGVPAKNSKGVRSSTEHHSSTPIRLGEQENQGLLVSNQSDEMRRLFRLYATDDVSREGLIGELLLRADPFSMARIEPAGSGVTRPVAGLDALLESIGLELTGAKDETKQEAETEDELTAGN